MCKNTRVLKHTGTQEHVHKQTNMHTNLEGGSVHRVFTAEHEADLAARVRRDCAVSVVHYGEERLAEGAHFLD